MHENSQCCCGMLTSGMRSAVSVTTTLFYTMALRGGAI
jgi:hypothetical protein